MKKFFVTLAWIIVIAGVAAAVYFFLLKPTETPSEVKNPVNDQDEQLSKRLIDLQAELKAPDSNVDSLVSLLQNLKWETITQDEQFELEKRNLFLDNKKNAAMEFSKVIQERGLTPNSYFDNIEAISE